MRTFPFLALIFICSATHALEVAKQQNGNIILKDSCQDGPNNISSLSKWLKKTQPTKDCQVDFSSDGETCLYDITKCLPEQVVKYQDTNPKVSGPNCWNLALVMGKILPNLRYASGDEMSFYMRPPLCKMLNANDSKQPGDIGAIRDSAWGIPTEEVHGFIYISDSMVYSKNGYINYNPYSLQSTNQMLDFYEVPKNDACRKNGFSKATAECSKTVTYYRCDSMDEFLQKNKISPDLKKLETQMRSAENCIEKSSFSGYPLNGSNLRDIRNVNESLNQYLKDLKQSNKMKTMSEEERFVVGSLQLRINAISRQLEEMQSGISETETPETYDLMVSFERAIRELKSTNKPKSEK